MFGGVPARLRNAITTNHTAALGFVTSTCAAPAAISQAYWRALQEGEWWRARTMPSLSKICLEADPLGRRTNGQGDNALSWPECGRLLVALKKMEEE